MSEPEPDIRTLTDAELQAQSVEASKLGGNAGWPLDALIREQLRRAQERAGHHQPPEGIHSAPVGHRGGA